MTTAAEKFDKVPPWCVVEHCYAWGVMSHDGTHLFMDGKWQRATLKGYIRTEPGARRIARLTHPLDSWEPGEDCPLPVEGWHVVFVPVRGVYRLETHTGPHTFTSRRAAYVWAWTEAEAPDENGAKDGPSDDRGTLNWAAFDELCKTTDHSINALDDRIGAVETKVEDMADVLARICPEADSQTDGKGRTLVEIDRQLDAVVGWMNDDARPEFDKIDDRYNVIRRDAETLERRTHSHEMRLTYLERLIAAQVAKPATLNTRSDDASTNEVMTDVAAVDDGWREMLVPVSFTHENSLMWWMTPDHKAYTGHCLNPSTDWGSFDSTLRDFVVVTDSRKDDPVYLAVRSKVAPPPNLAEWYKPDHVPEAGKKVDGWPEPVPGCTVDTRDDVRNAIPPAFRIPGTTLAGCVRNLAAAHEEALKVQEQLRQSIANEAAEGDKWYAERCDLKKQLADANAAAVAAEGRAHTAMKRASKAEEELADLRGKVENLRAAFSG